jgi:hypothetical protein
MKVTAIGRNRFTCLICHKNTNQPYQFLTGRNFKQQRSRCASPAKASLNVPDAVDKPERIGVEKPISKAAVTPWPVASDSFLHLQCLHGIPWVIPQAQNVTTFTMLKRLKHLIASLFGAPCSTPGIERRARQAVPQRWRVFSWNCQLGKTLYLI